MNKLKDTLHIYTRVSTTVQEEEGTSLETQKELGIKRSKKLGFKHKIWNEGSQSSSKDDLTNRPVLTKLLQEVQEGSVEHLFVFNTDRLSRSTQTWGFIRLTLIQNEVILHTPTGEMKISDPQTNLMLGIMSEFSQYDNKLRTERFRLGKLSRIREGYWKGGPPPYGYELKDGKLIENEDESKWVKLIHEWYKDGYSLQEIIDDLMNNGVLTRRGKPIWSSVSLYKLIQNTHYDGYWTYTDKKSGETIKVSCPRLVDPQTIREVKKSREGRSYGKGGTSRTSTSVTKYTYLLSKILICGDCGSPYYGNYSEKRVSYYHCSQKTNKYRDRQVKKLNCSKKRNVRLDITEKIVWDTVKDVVQQSHLFKETIKNEVIGQKSKKLSDQEKKKLLQRVKKTEGEIEKISSSIQNLITEDILSSRDQSEVIKRLEETRKDKEQNVIEITNQIQEIDVKDNWIDWLKEFKDRLGKMDKFTQEEKRDFIKGVVSKIVVSEHDTQKHRLEFTFLFPYVGDKLVYKDQKNKRKGYTVKRGRKTKSVKVDLLKKCTN